MTRVSGAWSLSLERWKFSGQGGLRMAALGMRCAQFGRRECMRVSLAIVLEAAV